MAIDWSRADEFVLNVCALHYVNNCSMTFSVIILVFLTRLYLSCMRESRPWGTVVKTKLVQNLLVRTQ